MPRAVCYCLGALVGASLFSILCSPLQAQSEDIGTLHQSAVELLQAGKPAEAESLFNRIVRLKETDLGPRDLALVVSLNNLASVIFVQRRFAEAELILRRALAIQEKHVGADDPELVLTLTNLAEACSEQFLWKDAAPLLERALAIQKKTLGIANPATQKISDKLESAKRLMHADDPNEARADRALPEMERLRAELEKKLGPEDQEVANLLNIMGELQIEAVRFQEAQNLLGRLLAIQEKALGPEDKAVAETLSRLAKIRSAHEQWEEAELLLKRGLAILEKAADTTQDGLTRVSLLRFALEKVELRLTRKRLQLTSP
jgi:tetratricopeptide (TPR) repeat protein